MGSTHIGERQLPVLFPLSHKSPNGWGRIDARFQSTLGNFVVKQAVIRQVKSLSMSCDQVGNLLLAKYSFQGGKDARVVIPASIVFWLLNHLPVNQDPSLQPPRNIPHITQQDWDDPANPRALSVRCKQFPDAIRMSFEFDQKSGLTLLLDRSNVELLRQMMENYRKDLIDLDA
jgi:hypothetical protein